MKKYMPVIVAVIILVFAAVSFAVLPESVIIQFSIGSSDVTRTSKVMAILIPTVIGILGAAMLKGEDSGKKNGLLLSVVGIAVFIILLVVNL